VKTKYNPRFVLFLVMAIFCLGYFCNECSAQPEQRKRSTEFSVPAKLRPRVDFWKDVFTRYGKHQMVVHHRDFPQVQFGILDFRQEAERLDAISLDKFKKEQSTAEVKRLRAIFERLGQGGAPATKEEREIVEKMRPLPGGFSKFKQAVEKDLIRTQTGIREKYEMAIKRSGRYLPIMEKIFRDYGLPVELTRLPFIESSFDYEAYSSVGAAGIWQFMPKTGRQYMTVNSVIDERRDPIEATRSAARYLEQAYNSLGTWPLAITSYNHGVAGVARKVRAYGSSNLVDIIEDPFERVFGFASINFYPEFLAAVEIFDSYHSYFPNVELYPALDLVQFRLTRSLSMHSVLAKLGMPAEQLRAVNYAISDRVWRGQNSLPTGYVLKIPSIYEERISRLYGAESPQVTASVSSAVYGGAVYKVKRGDTLLGIAKKHSTTVSKLKELNKLDSAKVVIGQVLIVSGRQKAEKNEQEDEAPIEPSRNYKVKRGDNLWSISKKSGASVQELKRLNKLKSNSLREGQSLRLP
jgi:membrane-bound lytic murein transglycosylase D